MAEPLHALLEVQDADVNLGQLRHRREALPERAQLDERRSSHRAVLADLAGVQARAGDLARSQRRFEDEATALQAKVSEVDATLYSGSVRAPRELQALQEESVGVKRRLGRVEDELLSVLEELEPVEAEIVKLSSARDDLVVEIDRLEFEITSSEAAIDAEVRSVEAERAAKAAAVAEDLLAEYQARRDRLGGIGVARLEGSRCTGCHLSLPSSEVEAVRRAPRDAVVTHEECGRILVRPRTA